jgi:hypothetical protein
MAIIGVSAALQHYRFGILRHFGQGNIGAFNGSPLNFDAGAVEKRRCPQAR